MSRRSLVAALAIAPAALSSAAATGAQLTLVPAVPISSSERSLLALEPVIGGLAEHYEDARVALRAARRSPDTGAAELGAANRAAGEAWRALSDALDAVHKLDADTLTGVRCKARMAFCTLPDAERAAIARSAAADLLWVVDGRFA